MKDSIRQTIRDIFGETNARDKVSNIPDLVWQNAKQRISTPCRQYIHHQRMLEKLESASRRRRVFALRIRLAHHRMWSRYWEAKCDALNLCSFDKGC